MRYSDNFLRDVRFYFRNRRKFDFFGGIVDPPPFSRNGLDGIKAFWLFDTKGQLRPTKHPRLFVALVRTKKSVNWHIREWADGFLDMFEPIIYYLNEFTNPPAWVEMSLRKAIVRNVDFYERTMYNRNSFSERINFACKVLLKVVAHHSSTTVVRHLK